MDNFVQLGERNLRNRKYADALRAQAAQIATPQGQMVSGHYVAPHWSEYLTKPLLAAMGGYYGGQADTADSELTGKQEAHAQQWRSTLPRAVAGVKGRPANFVMERPEDQEAQPDIPDAPLTAERVLKHALAAGGNPLLKDEAAAYAKYGMVDVENAEKLAAAAAEKQRQREHDAEQARLRDIEKGEQKAADRVERERQDRRDADLRRELAEIRRAGSGGGAGGFGGTAMVVGGDETGSPVFRAKSGALFKYDADGTPVPHVGPLGAKPAAAKDPTEAERSSAGYLGRMEAVETQMRGVGPLPLVKQAAVNHLPLLSNYLLNDKQQVTRAQQEDWVRAKLRKESGASIPADEMDREIRTYFPMPNDGADVVKVKTQARAQAAEQLRITAGRAKSVIAPDVGGPAAPGPGPAPAPVRKVIGGATYEKRGGQWYPL